MKVLFYFHLWPALTQQVIEFFQKISNSWSVPAQQFPKVWEFMITWTLWFLPICIHMRPPKPGLVSFIIYHVTSGPMRGLKKTAPFGTEPQNHRRTSQLYGGTDSMKIWQWTFKKNIFMINLNNVNIHKCETVKTFNF